MDRIIPALKLKMPLESKLPRCRILARRSAGRAEVRDAVATVCREFRDVVFEDVGFERHSLLILND